MDKARGTAKSTGFGGSIFGSSSALAFPPELKDLVAPQQAVSKQLLPVKSSLSTANTEYEKLMDSTAPLPAAPVYAARLNGLLRHLANAESAVAESVKARKALVAALEKILDTNRQTMEADEKQQKDLAIRKTIIEDKKHEVELAIMRNLSTNEEAQSPGEGPSASPGAEIDRPEVEALTPPPAQDDHDIYDNYPPAHSENGQHQSPPPPPYSHTPQDHHQQPTFPSSAPGIEMLSNLASQYQAVPVALNGSNKRRRVDSGEEFPDLGGDDGIDDEVAEILRKDGSGS